ENPGLLADEDHGAWYRELFAPSVAVGLLKPSDLAGYRNGQVPLFYQPEFLDSNVRKKAYVIRTLSHPCPSGISRFIGIPNSNVLSRVHDKCRDFLGILGVPGGTEQERRNFRHCSKLRESRSQVSYLFIRNLGDSPGKLVH